MEIGSRNAIFSDIVFYLTMLLSACSDPVKEQITQQIPITEQRINALSQALENGTVRNANLIKQYATKVLQLKPELAPLINEFKKDATPQGPMFLALVDRLNTIKNQSANVHFQPSIIRRDLKLISSS